MSSNKGNSNIKPIDPHCALPNLLACLATAAAAKQAPPSLVPLLTPINQQRVKLLASDGDETWLQQLSPRTSDQWASLLEIIGKDPFEPHPVSGEIELGFVPAPQYHRADEETTRAKITVPDLEITVIYSWCTEAEAGPPGQPDKWRVSEILPGTDVDGDLKWDPSIEVAEENYMSEARSKNSKIQDTRMGPVSDQETGIITTATSQSRDDDGYWDQYDMVASETPAEQRSPKSRTPVRQGEMGGHGVVAARELEQNNEDDDAYFGRYDNVQPALDNDDPAQMERKDLQTRFNSNAGEVANAFRDAKVGPLQVVNKDPDGRDDVLSDLDEPKPTSDHKSEETVVRLEGSATRQSTVELGIRQHVETGVQSMYALWKNMGMRRSDFDNLVKQTLVSIKVSENGVEHR